MSTPVGWYRMKGLYDNAGQETDGAVRLTQYCSACGRKLRITPYGQGMVLTLNDVANTRSGCCTAIVTTLLDTVTLEEVQRTEPVLKGHWRQEWHNETVKDCVGGGPELAKVFVPASHFSKPTPAKKRKP